MPGSAASLAAQAIMSVEEHALWDACHAGALEARQALFARYQPVARRIAWRFKRDRAGTAAEIAELYQLASVGLLEAMDAFKPELEVPFRYYCTRRIAGALSDGLSRLSEVSQQIGTRRQVERERLRSLRAEGREPRTLDEKLSLIGEIAAELAVGIMLQDSVMYLANDRDPAQNAYETLAWKQAVRRLGEVIDTLPERDRAIVRLHYLESVPFDQIGRLLGLSKGRISQLHKQALGTLQRRLSDMGNFRLEG